jgi:hypothetical protein
MKFNLWLMVLFALMPLFMLLAGLGIAGGPDALAAWVGMGAVAVAGGVAARLAGRRPRAEPPPARRLLGHEDQHPV